MTDLNTTISRCLDHVARIELDSRLTVREYRNLQAEGIADPLSDEQVELRRLRSELAATGELVGDWSETYVD